MWRLDATTEEIETLFRQYRLNKIKCLAFLCHNITTAVEILHIEPRKLLRQGHVLAAFPRYTEELLNRTLPEMQPELIEAIKKTPKLFSVPPGNFREIYTILEVSIYEGKLSENNLSYCAIIIIIIPVKLFLLVIELSV